VIFYKLEIVIANISIIHLNAAAISKVPFPNVCSIVMHNAAYALSIKKESFCASFHH
jgi:hypothetical protein